MNRLVDTGLADYDTFIQDVAKLAGVSPERARKDIENNVANEELLEFIGKDLKPQYQIGLLSNAGADWLDALIGKRYKALFDAIALSYETGVLKPQAEAYEIIAERLGVELKQCVFIDDNESYCAAAREAGMQAIWYQDFEQFKADLKKLLTKP